MTFGVTSLTAWGPVALLSLIWLETPGQAQISLPRPLSAQAVGVRSDVAQAVVRELSGDPHMQASGLSVAERNGIVELGGTVAVSSWRVRAARVASVVRDVRGVVNRISVVAQHRPDQATAQEVRRSLRATAALAKMLITVRVTDGVVALSGVISTWEQQQLAERVAVGVVGVRFCQNQLTSSRAMKRTARMIVADIRSRLDWDPFVRKAPVEVTVDHGRVTLRGSVGSPAERRRVIAHAWAKSVNAVDAKELVVDALKRPDSDVRLRFPTDLEISVALQELTPFWPSIASNVTMTVAAGVVTLRGTVQTLAQKRAAEEMAQSAVGVAEVKSELRGPWWRAPISVAPPSPKRPKRAPRGR